MDTKRIGEYFVALLLALLVAMVFFLMASTLLINSAMHSLTETVNSFTVDCSETMKFGKSFQFNWKGETIYCLIDQESVLDVIDNG